jgi:mannose-6-phosphate isomerase-like protein (cupin superfamily)
MDIGELEQAEPFVTVDGSIIRELAGPVSLPSAHQSLAEATLPAGGETAEHYHVVAEELYFFTAGAGRLRVGDDVRDVHAGHCAVIPPGTPHKLWNTGPDPLVLLCCCSPPYSHEDTILTGG